jgi:hypothetical protein
MVHLYFRQDRQRTYNVTLKHTREAVVAVEKQLVLHSTNVYQYSYLGYPKCKALASYYIAICGLSGAIFFHITSYTASLKKK